MSNAIKNRAALLTKFQTALKKHFKPAPASPGRPLLEHVLYASLLEESSTELADQAMAKCEEVFYDWNEVRVTTITELREVLSGLPNPTRAAQRLKNNLRAIFETFYSFDLDHLKKENLGKAVAKFQEMKSMTPFVLAYISQHGLGGHSIPVDHSAMHILLLCGIVNEAEAVTGKVPGLERAVPKNKGIEFASSLQQASHAFRCDTKDKAVRALILAVNKNAAAELDSLAKGKSEGTQTSKTTSKTTAPKSAAKTAKKTVKKAAEKKKAEPKKKVTKSAEEKPTTKKTAKKKAPAKKAAKKKTAKGAAKTDNKKLTKRKPR